MSYKRSHLFLLLYSITLFISCGDDPTCVDTSSSLVKVKFVDSAGKAKNITLLSLKAVDNLGGFPEYADTTLSSISLPLNPASNNSTFILEQASRTDSLGLSYRATAKLISPECGLDVAFDRLDTTFTTFNKLKFVEKTIHQDVLVNIEIIL